MSETVINWFTILYGVCAVVVAIYLVKNQAEYENFRKEKGLKRNTLDKIIIALVVFIAVSSIVIGYETIATIFKLF